MVKGGVFLLVLLVLLSSVFTVGDTQYAMKTSTSSIEKIGEKNETDAGFTYEERQAPLGLHISIFDTGPGAYPSIPGTHVLLTKPNFEIVAFYTEPAIIIAGNKVVSLHVRLRNTGSEKAESVSVRITGEGETPFDFSQDSQFVGNLTIDEEVEAILEFDVNNEAIPAVYSLGIEIRCIGDRNMDDDNVYIFNREIELKVFSARSWYVDDDLLDFPYADFTKIQDAVNIASQGDFIVIYNGTYIESVEIAKRLNIKGVGYPVIKGDSDIAAITVLSDNCVIQGLKVNGTSVRIYSKNNLIIDNYFSQQINIYSGNNCITTNYFIENGINVWNSNRNRFENNIFLNTTILSFNIWNSNDTVISNNKITGEIANIVLTDTVNSTIIDNHIESSAGCIDFEKGHNNFIIGNTITAKGMGNGLWINSSNYNIVMNNTINDSFKGLVLINSKYNQIYHNNFINNTEHAIDDNGTNIWDNGYPSGGNYWSDYTGVDEYSGLSQNQLGGDGIGDTPYLIPNAARDKYPFIYRNGWLTKGKINCMSLWTNRGVYGPREEMNVYLLISASENISDSIIEIKGVVSKKGVHYVSYSTVTDLVAGENTINFTEQLPSCTKCAGIDPGSYFINVSLLYGDEIVTATHSIIILDEPYHRSQNEINGGDAVFIGEHSLKFDTNGDGIYGDKTTGDVDFILEGIKCTEQLPISVSVEGWTVPYTIEGKYTVKILDDIAGGLDDGDEVYIDEATIKGDVLLNLVTQDSVVGKNVSNCLEIVFKVQTNIGYIIPGGKVNIKLLGPRGIEIGCVDGQDLNDIFILGTTMFVGDPTPTTTAPAYTDALDLESMTMGTYTVQFKLDEESCNFLSVSSSIMEFTIQVPPAKFNDVYAEYGEDTDGDGLYDYLVVNVGINVSEAGNYGIFGDLYENGTQNFVDRDDNTTVLTEGEQFIQLRFDGRRLRQNKYDGLYDLRVLTLRDFSSPAPPTPAPSTPTPTATPPPPATATSATCPISGPVLQRGDITRRTSNISFGYGEQLDYRNYAYTTPYYKYREFQTPAAQFNDIYSDYGEDTDGDGLFNYLVINVGVNVSEAGYYRVNGELHEHGTYNFVGSDSNTTYLSEGGQVVQLQFDAWSIMNSGTFDLVYLWLYNATYPQPTPAPPPTATPTTAVTPAGSLKREIRTNGNIHVGYGEQLDYRYYAYTTGYYESLRPHLSSSLSRDTSYPGGTILVTGTAGGTEHVDLITISPKGGNGTGLYGVGYSGIQGVTAESIPVINNSFSKTINISEQVDIGNYIIWISIPGLDGFYGNGCSINASGLIEQVIHDYCSGNASELRIKNQWQIFAILEDIITSAGSDDLACVDYLIVETCEIFDSRTPINPYPSISGTFNGTITTSCNLMVSKLYTYPCPGTGGHTEYAAIYYSNGTMIAEAHWNGYVGDWHTITFDAPFTLVADETYSYIIITGSYPQIHHTNLLNTSNGWIRCTGFTDANGAATLMQAVAYNKLIAFLPKAPSGWEAGEPQGFSFTHEEGTWSMATSDYTKAGAEDVIANVRITDYALYPTGWTGIWSPLYAWESPEGYGKWVTVEGYPGWEGNYNPTNEYSLFVGLNDRFLVSVGTNSDKDTLYNFADIDYNGIAALGSDVNWIPAIKLY